MKVDDARLKEILLRGNYVTAEDINAAEKYAKTHRTSIIDYLMTNGLLTKDLLGQAIAEAYHVPYADLNTNRPSRDQVLKIPEDIARKYRLAIYSERDKKLIITTDVPDQEGLAAFLAQVFPGKTITIAYSLGEDIDQVFIHYRKPLETRFAKIIEAKQRVAPDLIDEIFEDALAYKASDVHFEPQRSELAVRFRIDGVLHEAGRFEKRYYENILNRIKIQSEMRIDEHFSAQDGSIRYVTKGGQQVDLRVSVAPTLNGEKTVIRILAHYVRGFTLGDLGLMTEDQQVIEDASKRPYGMILMTGPTGSGKTTTLYAVLRFLNRPEVNITTIEDPVEYRVDGVNQIQVNPQTNLTFAKGLRSIIRQDPDIILVGEIRDEETAQIAVNAALTGHLMLSTFHANNAASAIPRLLDMRAEPFLLASTLEVVAAQRLVRRLCDQCRYSISVSPAEIAAYGPEVKQYFPGDRVTLYRAKGCPACNFTGYAGRIGIFEIIQMTPQLRDLVLTKPSAQEIWKLARKEGARSLFEDGVKKVKNGMTSLEELLRVSAPPEMMNNA